MSLSPDKIWIINDKSVIWVEDVAAAVRELQEKVAKRKCELETTTVDNEEEAISKHIPP